jgi:AcrR family transcriptional regulator
MATTTTRQTADQRRETVLDAAMIEFGLKGLHGASTDDIARRAGISQPYLFRLFRTKRELFLASVERCFRRTEQTFRDAVTGDTPEQRLQSMGLAYCELLADRPKLMMQMQAYAACDDPDVRDTVRRCYEHLHREVTAMAGADAEQIRAWLSTGMFLNVMAAMDAPSVKGAWMKELMGDLMLEKLRTP